MQGAKEGEKLSLKKARNGNELLQEGLKEKWKERKGKEDCLLLKERGLLRADKNEKTRKLERNIKRRHTGAETEETVKERGRGKLQSAMQEEGNKKTIPASADGCMSVDTPVPAFTHSNIHPHRPPSLFAFTTLHCCLPFCISLHC